MSRIEPERGQKAFQAGVASGTRRPASGLSQNLRGILHALCQEAKKHGALSVRRNSGDTDLAAEPGGLGSDTGTQGNSNSQGEGDEHICPPGDGRELVSFSMPSPLDAPESPSEDADVNDEENVRVLVCGGSTSGGLFDLLDSNNMLTPSSAFAVGHRSIYSNSAEFHRYNNGQTPAFVSPNSGPRVFEQRDDLGASGLLESPVVVGQSDPRTATAGGPLPSAQKVIMTWDTNKERPWRHRPQDVSPWFNYGFTEASFKVCAGTY